MCKANKNNNVSECYGSITERFFPRNRKRYQGLFVQPMVFTKELEYSNSLFLHRNRNIYGFLYSLSFAQLTQCMHADPCTFKVTGLCINIYVHTNILHKSVQDCVELWHFAVVLIARCHNYTQQKFKHESFCYVCMFIN